MKIPKHRHQIPEPVNALAPETAAAARSAPLGAALGAALSEPAKGSVEQQEAAKKAAAKQRASAPKKKEA